MGYQSRYRGIVLSGCTDTCDDASAILEISIRPYIHCREGSQPKVELVVLKARVDSPLSTPKTI